MGSARGRELPAQPPVLAHTGRSLGPRASGSVISSLRGCTGRLSAGFLSSLVTVRPELIGCVAASLNKGPV